MRLVEECQYGRLFRSSSFWCFDLE